MVYRFCMVKGSPFKLQAVRAVGFLAFGAALVFIFPGLMKAPVEGVLCAALGGLSANFVGDSFYMYDIRRVGPSASAAVGGTYPLFAALLSVTVLREPMTAGVMAGVGTVLAGLTLFQSRGGENLAATRPEDVRRGLLLSLLAAFFWGVSFVSARWAVTRGGMTAPGIVFWQSLSFFAMSWLWWGFLWNRTGRKEPFVRWSLKETLAMYAVGAFSLGLAAGLTSAALKYAPASVVTTIAATGPIITAFWGRFLLGERLGPRQWLGIVLILGGGVLLTLG